MPETSIVLSDDPPAPVAIITESTAQGKSYTLITS